jgi:flagellar hook protein FlgE
MRNNAELLRSYAASLSNFEKSNVARDMVGLIVAEKGFKANVTSLKTAIRMQDCLLDIFA